MTCQVAGHGPGRTVGMVRSDVGESSLPIHAACSRQAAPILLPQAFTSHALYFKADLQFWTAPTGHAGYRKPYPVLRPSSVQIYTTFLLTVYMKNQRSSPSLAIMYGVDDATGTTYKSNTLVA